MSSSFKKKIAAKQPSSLPGTRPSPSSLSTIITSTGIPSLDDILGGGLPLSCSLLVLCPDLHSAYGELVQKYFIAQGLACGQNVCIIEDDAREFVKDCMWMPGTATAAGLSNNGADGEEDEKADQQYGDKIKIAWRYEQMKQFQTTIPSSASSTEEYCRTLDLTCRIPRSDIEDALRSGQLSFLSVDGADSEESSSTKILCQIAQVLKAEKARPSSSTPLRICIPSFGSPQWGALRSQNILHFLHSFRSLLRQYPHVCASLSLPPYLSTDVWGGPGWIQKLGWLSDAALTLTAFTANPSLSAIFPSHHGLLHIHTLPCPHTLLPPSDKFSTLRGLASSALSAGGSGENNLAFKCTRKRLIFETLHLDLEGGVGERRTKPPADAPGLDAGLMHDPGMSQETHAFKTASAAVQVQLEGTEMANPGVATIDSEVKDPAVIVDAKPKKPKKKVVFRSDRPELYDF